MDNNYNQMNIGQMQGQMPMGGPGAGMPQAPMGAPGMGMPSQYPMGAPGMGMPPQYPMGAPGMGMPSQYPMGAQMMGTPMVQAPMVPYQGIQNTTGSYTKKRDETAERRIKNMMSSVYVLALAIIFSVQIVCIIVATVFRVGFVGYSFLIPYILMAVTAWLTWATAKKEKYNNASGVLIMVSGIVGIVVAAFIAFLVGLFLFVWTFAWDDMSSLADSLLYNFFGIKSRFRSMGAASVLVSNIMFIAPIVLFIMLQAKLIGFRKILNSVIKKQIGDIPKTKFTAVLLFIFAACSIATVVLYIDILSRALVRVGFVFFGVFLVLNVAMFGLMGFIMLRIGRKKTEEEEATYR